MSTSTGCLTNYIRFRITAEDADTLAAAARSQQMTRSVFLRNYIRSQALTEGLKSKSSK